jgi:hypothetical protein
LQLDQLSSTLASGYPFLNDIIQRALIILNNNQCYHHVLNELCAQVVKTRSNDSPELQQFVQEKCAQLKIEVSVDKLSIPGVLMQCQVSHYNESKPCQIFVNLSVNAKKNILFTHIYLSLLQWYKSILKIDKHDKEYELHIVLGVIKMIHEFCHCCTSVFCDFASSINHEKKP